MIQYPYALYLDSKIIGAARQLVAFFKQGIFDPHQTIIYLKKYKESATLYAKIFKAEGIAYQFMKPSELDNLKGQIIFYAFNAQSNCRLVANRKLKHIFITHGESNKIASVKPIIRIYDHVVMAGELSLERYYKSGLFDKHDYETGRLIMMGDTFIGRTGFSSDSTKENVLFYAPTWEGGLESENYSSLQNIELVCSTILQLAEKLQLKTIVVQAHPNTGHRVKSYINSLFSLFLFLSNSGFKIYFHQNYISISWKNKYFLSKWKVETIHHLDNFYARHALVDISAMEFQCMNEGICHNVFYKPDTIREYIPNEFYEKYNRVGLSLEQRDSILNLLFDSPPYLSNVIGFSLDECKNMSRHRRIKALVQMFK